MCFVIYIVFFVIIVFFRVLLVFEDGDFGEVREKFELVLGVFLFDFGVNNYNYSLWSCKEKLDFINK